MPSALDWRNPQVQKKLSLADVLVFQRNVLIPEVWSAMDYWRAIGKVVVVDLDDHYPELPGSNPAHPYWIKNINGLQPPPIDSLAEGMRHADALTSPSKVILSDWSHIIQGFWLPNWTRRAWYEPLIQKPWGAPDIEFDYDPDGEDHKFRGKARPDSEGKIYLGWGGSISHVDSWVFSGICEALDMIFEKYPQVYLKFCGRENRLDYILNRWGNRVIRQTGVRAEHWPQIVASFDIGLAPLDTRPLDPPWREGAPIASYDERRSWLKAVEYMSAGVPWIASRSKTYEDLSRWGTCVENTPDKWLQALSSKIDNLKAIKQMAWENRRWALRNVTFEPNVSRYASIFGRIAAHKATRFNEGALPDITYVTQIPTGAAI